MSPVLNGHRAYDQRESEGQDEPGGALPLGIQEWHPKRVCRKGFRRQHGSRRALAPAAFGREIGCLTLLPWQG